ncbi:MAG: phage holin family protein [Muribaculaceae bacterium]|nr:phage holin family protein [Muribaculaceae bacterium]
MNEEVDYKRLFEEGRKYLKLEFDYGRLTVVEKLTILLSAIALIAVLAIVGAFVLFYVLQAIAEALQDVTGSVWGANLLVVLLLVIVMAFVVAMKQKLIVNPIARFLTKLFLNPSDGDENS